MPLSWMSLNCRLTFLALSFALALTFTSCERSENRAKPEPPVSTATHAGSDSSLPSESHESCLNLNTAAAGELIRLPGVGEVIAKRIVDYRDRHGRFRRPEEIIIIEGFSEQKYRAIAELVCVE